MRGLLVDDHYERRTCVVALGVSPTLDHRNAHRAKVIRSNASIVHHRPLVRSRNRTTLDAESRRWSFVQREGVYEAGILHAGSRADLLEHLGVKLVEVSLLREV